MVDMTNLRRRESISDRHDSELSVTHFCSWQWFTVGSIIRGLFGGYTALEGRIQPTTAECQHTDGEAYLSEQ